VDQRDQLADRGAGQAVSDADLHGSDLRVHLRAALADGEVATGPRQRASRPR
jgi:hypothetical protein